MEVLKYSGRLCGQKPDVFYSKPVQLALSIFQVSVCAEDIHFVLHCLTLRLINPILISG
jgi:hypothetical protein